LNSLSNNAHLQTKDFAIFVNSSALRKWWFLWNFRQQQLQMNSENDDTKTSLQQSINQKRMHHNETCLSCHKQFVNNSRAQLPSINSVLG